MNLIPLQTAYIRQSRDVKDNTWIIFNSETDEEIGELPSDFSPKEAMSYLHFARKFELEALNIGIRHGRSIEVDASDKIFQSMKNKIKELSVQNMGLSVQLEKFIINGV